MRATLLGVWLLLALTALGCGSSGGSSGGGVATATAATTSAATPTPAATLPPRSGRSQWPIVLVHGIFGVRQIGSWQYFQDVERHLVVRGYEVYVSNVPPLAGIEARAAALRAELLVRFPDPRIKLNIVAHSMGGLDARALVVRHGLGQRVASISMISTPNRGSPVADMAVGLIPGNAQVATDQLLNTIGLDWDGVLDLTTARTAAFNAITPDVPGIVYQSWAACADPFGRQTGTRLQPLLWPSWGIIMGTVAHNGGPNDGLVAPPSVQWGAFRGVLPTDHAGEVGHTTISPAFDHLRFYADLADDLVSQGL